MEAWNDFVLINKIKRRRKKPEVDSYVLVSRWADLDPNDPWRIGFVKEIRITSSGTHYILTDYPRHWKHARIISSEEGSIILNKVAI